MLILVLDGEEGNFGFGGLVCHRLIEDIKYGGCRLVMAIGTRDGWMQRWMFF